MSQGAGGQRIGEKSIHQHPKRFLDLGLGVNCQANDFRITNPRIINFYYCANLEHHPNYPRNMATLADELLNDFEDSGSEGEEEQQNGFLQDGSTPPAVNGQGNAPEGSMILDDDEEDVDDDEEMGGEGGLVNGAVADAEDEEAAKAKVEKMQLGGVNDVRSVAGLMKTLEPVLEVCGFSFTYARLLCVTSFTSAVDIDLTLLVTTRKSPTTRNNHQLTRQRSSARSRTTLSITFLHIPTLSPLRSITRSSWFISTSGIITLFVSPSWKLLSQILSTTPNQWPLLAMGPWKILKDWLNKRTISLVHR